MNLFAFVSCTFNFSFVHGPTYYYALRQTSVSARGIRIVQSQAFV